MPPSIDSPLFGECTIADPPVRSQIEELVRLHPVDVFQALNIALNQRGYCINISRLEHHG